MVIRRKDNHNMIIPLPRGFTRAEHGWLVPIFSEFPDDFYISYLDQDWEPVMQDHVIAKGGLKRELGSFLYSIISSLSIPKNPFL